MGTIISLILALGTLFGFGIHLENLSWLSVLQVVSGAVILVTAALINLLMLIPLQRVENNLAPRLIELVRKDTLLKGANAIFLLFSLVSFALSMGLGLSLEISFAIWIVFFGFALDCLFLAIRRISHYLNPFAIVSLMVKNAEHAVKAGQNGDVCQWGDALAETAIKSIQNSSTAVCDTALKQFETLTCDYVKACTVRASKTAGTAAFEGERLEQIYTISYLLQRFQFIHTKAVDARFEPLASSLIMALGKITLFIAKYDPPMTSLPLHFMGEFVSYAQANQLPEVAVKATITLQEVAKNILEDPLIMRGEVKEIFFNLISHLETIAKETFRQDKTINLTILTQPFQDLKKLLVADKYASHPDVPVILSDIDRVLGEFQALEVVLRTIPNIPGYSDEDQQAEGTPPEEKKS